MNSLNTLLPVTIRAAMAVALSIAAVNVHAKASPRAEQPHALFSEEQTMQRAALRQHPGKNRSRTVKINRKNLRQGRFSVSLPGGVSYEAVRELHHDMGEKRYSWVGHASDDSDNQVVIGISGDAVAGTFAYHGKLFKLEPRADGSHVLSEVENTSPAQELDPVPVTDVILNQQNLNYVAPVAADSEDPIIDVLVAYTPAIKAIYGTAGAEALIIQAVAEANQAYANSNMKVRINLVHSVELDYVESGDVYADLDRLRATNDGYMDEIHTLRNDYGADLVSVISNESQVCGLGYLMTNLSPTFQHSAFSIVSHTCATGYYSFAHELGHNQGAHHDPAHASGALFPYAYGYQDPLRRFRTVMAYDCPGGCPRQPGFSSGENFIWGIPTGDASFASNATAIDQTAATVAAFRRPPVAPITPPEFPPSSLHSSEAGADFLRLQWTDETSDESGFLLERSTDGVDFSRIASLPLDTETYLDDNLSPETMYYYRIKGWNGGGYSEYSSIAVATTTAIPPNYVEQFASFELGATMTDGSFSDTKQLDGSRETLTEIPSWDYLWNRYGYLEHYWLFQVQPGATITLFADISVTAPTQSFTFAYASSALSVTDHSEAWTDMFTVSAQNPGAKQFTLPATLDGQVFISVRDNERVARRITSDSIHIDYLMIRTQLD